MKRFKRIILFIVLCSFIFFSGKGAYWIARQIEQNQILRKVIQRLSAESRIAEVLVTRSTYNEKTQKIETTIKFLEYDAQQKPLPARYFTFRGNLIQFQALVIRFEDKLVQAGDKVRGKSAYIFLRAFMLDEQDTQVFNITEINQIPRGYKIPGVQNKFEQRLWEGFWQYALDPNAREHARIKNAQIEAPGSMFLPGTIYTIRIEHDGGIRIDAQPVPEILKGEKV